MKTKKTLFGIIVVASLMTSCFDDETYQAGFVVENPTNSINYYYANNVSDSLIFYGYGNWEMIDLDGYDNTWITIPTRSGKGYVEYSQLMTFQQNTTGKGRMGAIRIKDTSHPDEAHASLAFMQYATRGDGSFGAAADVKSITGSDGSNITFEYDILHRPTLVKMTKAEQILGNLQISYGATQMTIQDQKNNNTFTVDCGKDYQPKFLQNNGDTIGYFSLYSNYVAIAANYMFRFGRYGLTSSSSAIYRFPYNGCSLSPDSIHNVDTIYYYKDGEFERKLGMTYNSALDNRYQSVDVNQLLLGVEECDPYLLASLFRYTRNTYIISEAKNNEEQITVYTALNNDKSVSALRVTRGSETITYTFNY